eukprot:5760845-Prymnesium_polylepis.1
MAHRHSMPRAQTLDATRRPEWGGIDLELGRSLNAKSQAIRARLQSSPAEDGDTAAAASPPLRVCVRVRPVLAHESERMGCPIDGATAASFAQYEYEACMAQRPRRQVVLLGEKRKVGAPTGELEETAFTADDVFGDADSDDVVYAAAAGPLVERALSGGATALIAFGQTGAGKTHTSQAMVRRALAALLQRTCVRLSFYELCGERCRDLLRAFGRGERAADDGAQTGTGMGDEAATEYLELRTTPLGLRVCGLSEVELTSLDDADAVLSAANTARATAPTAANDRSSRSHAICVITPVIARRTAEVERAEGEEGGHGASGKNGHIAGDAAGQLLFVDLAGSERREDCGKHDRARLAETAATNTSLAALKECVRLLRQQGEAHDGSIDSGVDSGGARRGAPAHVPFRRSKLT